MFGTVICAAGVFGDQTSTPEGLGSAARHPGLFLNNGNGTLDSRELEIAAENRIYSLVVTTLNRNRYPDLVTVDWEQDTLSVSLGHEPER